MTNIRQGFFTNSSQAKNEERKQMPFLLTSCLFLTYILLNRDRISNKNDENYNDTTSQKKSRKQMKSALHQKVSEFHPSDQMSMEQLIKVVLNLQEEIKKLCKQNSQLTEFINNGLQDSLNLKMANQEREKLPMKLLKKAVQSDELLSLENARKKCSDGEHAPKLKKLIQSTKLKRTHY